jgi:hypothetical protein
VAEALRLHVSHNRRREHFHSSLGPSGDVGELNRLAGSVGIEKQRRRIYLI